MAIRKPRYLLKYEGSYRQAQILIESLQRQIDKNFECSTRAHEAETSFCIELSLYRSLAIVVEEEE